MSRAFLIKPHLPTEAVEPENGNYFTLEELKTLVGGQIEMINTIDGRYAVANIEGHKKNLPINFRATYYHTRKRYMVQGNVLICDKGLIITKL